MRKNKQTIKLNENQLRNIIKESINKVLNESFDADEKYGWVIAHYYHGLSDNGPEDSQRTFSSKDEALNDGLQHFIKYVDKGKYGLQLCKLVYNEEYDEYFPEILDAPLVINEWDGIRLYKDENNPDNYEIIEL